MGLITRYSQNVKVEFKEVVSGSDVWWDVPGISGISASGGEAPSTDDAAFAGGATRNIGALRVQSLECTGFYVPNHVAWDKAIDLAENQSSTDWRITIPEISLYSNKDAGAKIQVTVNTGAVTFTAGGGTAIDLADRKFGPGAALIYGASGSEAILNVTSVDHTAKTMTVFPTTAVTETTAIHKVVLPQLTLTFPAFVASVGNPSLESESSMTSPLNLSPIARLPKWKAVATAV